MIKPHSILILPVFLILVQQNANAQFGTIPQLITKSTNGNMLDLSTADLDADGDQDVLCTHSNSLIWYENINGKADFSVDRELIAMDLRNAIGFYGAQFFDFDEDGLSDLAADLYWRKNLGNGQFAPQATLFSASLAALADLDGDGRKDAVTRDNSKIYWQKNLGNGSFAARQTIRNASAADIFDANCDSDSDGRADFFANWGSRLVWFKNKGDATFDTVRLSNTVANAVLTQDFNQNGKPDLLAAIDANIFWYEFDGSGLPTLIQTIPQYYSGQLMLADIDSNGFPDLFAGGTKTNQGTRARYYAFDPATGKFDPAPKNHNTYLYRHLFSKWADLDSDGHADILAGDISSVSWVRYVSPGLFSAAVNFTGLLGIPKEIVAADLENDGDEDLFTVGYVFEKLGNSQFAQKRPGAVAGSRHFSGDLDADGIKDIALPFGDAISWRKGLGNGQFSAPVLLPGLVTSCKQVGGADLDDDGDLDLFACNGTDAVAPNARFYWFENDGNGHFTEHLLETGIQLCSGAYTLDVNEDGRPDIWLSFFNGGAPRLYENQGGGQFALKPLFTGALPNPPDVNQFMLTDLDADGRLDFVYTNKQWSETKCAWFRNLGGSFSTEQVLLKINQNASWGTPYFTIFDATLDGLPDVVVSDNYWTRFWLIRGLGNSSFDQGTVVYDEPNTYGQFFGITPSDVDGDGKADLVFGSRTFDIGGYNQLSWLSNELPTPQPQILILNQSVGCEDNGTPADGTDDIRVLRMTVNNPAGLSERYFLTEFSATARLDTFWYNQVQVFRFPPGSAGDGMVKTLEMHDLKDPSVTALIFAQPVSPCSVDAPVTIGIIEQNFWCDDSGTPAEPADDRVGFYFYAQLFNPQTPSAEFHLTSNLGTVEQYGTAIENQGSYDQLITYFLPEGSAGAPGPVVLTLRDKADTSIVQTLVFDNPGICSTSSAAEIADQSSCQISPNPLPAGAPLRIVLETDFHGELTIEFLDLDGRLLSIFKEEKTVARQVFDLDNLPDTNSFFVRVSDGSRASTRLITRF